MTRKQIGLASCLLFAVACGSDDASDPALSGPTIQVAEEAATMSVLDGCATVTEQGSGRVLVSTCEPPRSNPVYAWGTDTPTVSLNLIRLPPGTELSAVEPDTASGTYDRASGWLKLEFNLSSEPPVFFLTQNDELFRCQLQYLALDCGRA